MRRAGRSLLCALGLALGAALGAAPANAAGDAGTAEATEALDAEWSERLRDAELRREEARRRVFAAESELTRARHRKRPRGEALEALEQAARDAREALDAVEAELPVLLEHARRAGVSPAVLMRFESGDAGAAASD